jgi:hypothetical protein
LYTLCMKLHKDRGSLPLSGEGTIQGFLHLPVTELVTLYLS